MGQLLIDYIRVSVSSGTYLRTRANVLAAFKNTGQSFKYFIRLSYIMITTTRVKGYNYKIPSTGYQPQLEPTEPTEYIFNCTLNIPSRRQESTNILGGVDESHIL
jgi:hypothetical protein